jgi:hypothetical protein
LSSDGRHLPLSCIRLVRIVSVVGKSKLSEIAAAAIFLGFLFSTALLTDNGAASAIAANTLLARDDMSGWERNRLLASSKLTN